ncbi:universal stress protein [uncultured Hydrogenophaga sp.]|uniref:universal stress protein n=1 Tax=uncultured Hydrogenophaga sp. TaxID=199683 RepID=UPI00258A3D90|nr:universal stress protein [uncultured Hydrogenophaga sp.]
MLRVLIPIDGTKASMAAVRHVLALVGTGLRARCVLANVQASANLYEVVVARDPAVLDRVAEEAGRELLKPALQLLNAAGVGAEVEVVHQGDVGPALLDLADRHDVDIIVVGADAPGLADRVLGSVTLDLVQNARVPVTVVRVGD